ncbi:hypothetical protein [Phenylobacterium sp. Root700]|uniref:hypothetical protein n=1 Tax=Phenylobacterium sp. Root700 TaxID=1736591 RepID=UPI0006F570EA|nr:hypothetical protein [Phenylobacterium sp. Root700]KRB40578.1 hypothetical protein ASE02_07705 [Phenylobacterium sp. Root700]
MSCSAAALLSTLWLATAPAGPATAAPPPAAAVAIEPLFADIVRRAGVLKAEVEAFKGKTAPIPATFKQQVSELAALDMQAHRTLAERNLDGDLKCILRGISEDLPLKLKALEEAATASDRDLAVTDMGYLLNDNVEVITAPPQAPV